MSLQSKYELSELIRDGTIKTFRARQLRSGAWVAVHIFPQGPDKERMVTMLRRLGASSTQSFLDRGEQEDPGYVVTVDWDRAETFDQWMAESTANRAPSEGRPQASQWRIPAADFNQKGAQSPASAKAPGSADMDFASIFKTPERPVRGKPAPIPQPAESEIFLSTPPVPEPPVPPSPPPVPEPREPSPPTVPAAAPSPGEFTMMFQKPAPPVENPTPAAEKEMGEFTRMFQLGSLGQPLQAPPASLAPAESTPAAPPPPLVPEAAAPAPPSSPGEFTRQFMSPAAPASAGASGGAPFDAPLPVKPKDPEPAPAPAEALTRLFKIPDAPPAPAPVSDPFESSPPGEFTRMFKVPAPPPQDDIMQSAPASRPAPANSDPGEFSRFFEPQPERAGPNSHPAMQEPFSPPTPAPRAQSGDEGDFTRIFGVSSKPAPGSGAPNYGSGGPASATGAFSMPSRGLSPHSPSPAGSGPGDYTQMFAPGAVGQPFDPPPPPPPANAGPGLAGLPAGVPAVPKSSHVPIIIGLSVLLVIAIALVLFFAFTK